MAKKQSYDNESITMLKGPDKVRKRPGVIFGSDGLDGCAHSVFEIISNSIDEARAGYGSKIVVTRYQDNSIEVEDFGRGCPVDFNKNENRYNWELVYCELYAGGKYNSNDDNYAYSLGLNGLGLCATQFASSYMDVEIIRDGFQYNLHFEKGVNVGGLQKKPTKKKQTGTRTHWLPDLDVFTEIEIPDDYFCDTLRRQAVVNPNLLFLYRKEEADGTFTERQYLYENGIADYVREIAGENTLTSVQNWSCQREGRDREDKPTYKVKLNVALTFSNQVQRLEYYHNSSWLEHGGSPDKAVRQALVSQIDTYLRQNNKYLKSEAKLKFEDVESSLVLISSSFSTETSYENQTKKAITNKFIYEAMTEFLKHQLEIYFIENPDEAEKIAAQVLINKRSRENAEKTRLNLKKKLTGSIDVTNMIPKFVDCRSKDLSRRELYIVEGDSAGGSAKTARNRMYQAILPIRGKILNVEKASIDKVLANAEIKTMINAFGCGFSEGYGNDFDITRLRYDKIIIMADADVDGAHISTLLLTLFYRFMPDLIFEGHVYIAMPPLYKAMPSKGEEKYLYDDKALEKYRKTHKGPFTLQRYKGLGEMDAEQLWETTLDPERRLLKLVEIEDARMASEMTELLMGTDVPPRKAFIYDHATDAELDI